MIKGILGGLIVFASIAISWVILMWYSLQVSITELSRTNPFKASVVDAIFIFSYLVYPLSGVLFAFAPKFLPDNIANFKNAMIFYVSLPVFFGMVVFLLAI